MIGINHFPGGKAPFKMSLQRLPGREGIDAVTHAVPAEGSHVVVAVPEGVGAAGFFAGRHCTCVGVAVGISDGSTVGQLAILGQITGIGDSNALEQMVGVRAGKG